MYYPLKIRDSRGRIIEALQEVPDKGDKFPTIIMVPGFGVDLHEYGLFDDICDRLVKNGFNTVRFSFAGTGKSEGEFINTTVEKQAEQIQDVINYVLKDRFTDLDRIGLLAQSFGVIPTSALLPISAVKSFIFLSATGDPDETLSKRFKRQRGYEPEGVSKMERVDHTNTKIGPQFWKSLKQQKLIHKMRQITQSTLFIHGSKDRLVPGRTALKLFDSIVSPKKFHIIEKSDHAFTGPFRTVALKLITEWFERTLA